MLNPRIKQFANPTPFIQEGLNEYFDSDRTFLLQSELRATEQNKYITLDLFADYLYEHNLLSENNFDCTHIPEHHFTEKRINAFKDWLTGF